MVEQEVEQGIQLQPLQPPEGWVPGKYASFPVSPEPMYGPDELGDYKQSIDDMQDTVTRTDSAARNWEVLKAWEAAFLYENNQFFNFGARGLSMYGGINGTRATGAEILQSQNAGKLFSCNVYGARADKIAAILAVDVPGLTFVPKRDKDPMDTTAADEAKKYLQAWLIDAGIKERVGEIAYYFYTDDRVVLWTTSWADEQEWGTETPESRGVFGEGQPEGVSPETEMQPQGMESDIPAVRELTLTCGKLEAKVPMAADRMGQMPWIRIAREESVNILQERYPWIEDKIKAGGKSEGRDQLDRQARLSVRLVVQNSGSSGESLQQDATESFTWYRPSQYRSIKNKDFREACYKYFPDGLLCVYAGGELAFVRNEGMNRHLKVIHSRHGRGQNRRAIGSNYLPLQKILNANISLVSRYFLTCIPRKFHDSEAINSEAIQGQSNDPNQSTPVLLKAGQSIADVTGLENTPQPSNGIFEFVQWLIQGAPEAMDGGEPAMFGAQTSEADQGVYQTAKLKRDAARGIYAIPWAQICMGMAGAAEQAVWNAARNRVGNIRSNVPGQGKLEVELGKLQGEVLCYPESLDIPQTIAEQEAQVAALLENGQNVLLYKSITEDPRNLPYFSKFPSLSGLEIPGLDAVEQQEGEFELLLQSGPVDNPQIQQIQQQIQEGQTHPEAQTPEGQQAMGQLQQALQSMPPQVSSVPVAQDGSENHALHAQVSLGWLTSPEGRKYKNGDEEQKLIWENVHLHWQEHVQMSEKLTPPQPMEFKGSVSVDPSKYAPEAQAKIFEAMGLQVAPQELENHELIPHEVTTEKEGVDENGIPVKQKIAMINPAGKLK